MVDTRLAKRYADALFRTAKQAGIVAAVEADLVSIADLIAANESFRTFLLSPTTGREHKLGLVDRVFGDRVTALTLEALRLVLIKGREDHLVAIKNSYVDLRRKDDGIVFATVTSSEVLTDGHKNAIVHKIGDQLGKKVEAAFHVDPALMGGVKVAYDDFVLDGTVRGALGKLREKLRYDLLKQI